jgi:hypothetical protein
VGVDDPGPQLNAAMKRLVLGKDWVTKQMKAGRFRLIGLPGRVSVTLAVDYPPGRRGRGIGDLHQRPSDDPRPGMRACRIKRRGDPHQAKFHLMHCPSGPACLSMPP